MACSSWRLASGESRAGRRKTPVRATGRVERVRRLCRVRDQGAVPVVAGDSRLSGAVRLPRNTIDWGTCWGAAAAQMRARHWPERLQGSRSLSRDAAPCSLRCAGTGRYAYPDRLPLGGSLRGPSSLPFGERSQVPLRDCFHARYVSPRRAGGAPRDGGHLPRRRLWHSACGLDWCTWR
jgi:hypothetical protein